MDKLCHSLVLECAVVEYVQGWRECTTVVWLCVFKQDKCSVCMSCLLRDGEGHVQHVLPPVRPLYRLVCGCVMLSICGRIVQNLSSFEVCR